MSFPGFGCLLVCYLIGLVPLLRAQPAESPSLGTRNGLSHPYISEILQTRDGYVWIATNEGINRYDGYTFKQYINKDHNPFGLTDFRIRSVYEDRRGRLWIGTKQEGLVLLDRTHHRFFRMHFGTQPKPDDADFTVFRIVEDPAGNLWIGTDMGVLYKVTIPPNWAYPSQPEFTGELTIEAIPVFDGAKDIRHMHMDGADLWCCLSNGRVFRLNTQTREKQEFPLPSLGSQQAQREITGLYQDAQKNIWVCRATDGLTRLSSAGTQHWPGVSRTGQLANLWLDRTGFVWIRDPLTYAVWRVHHTAYASFNPTAHRPLFVSRSKSYKSFITTADSILLIGDVRGVRKLRLRPARFAHYAEETDISELFVSAKGRMLVGTGGITVNYAEHLPTQKAFSQLVKGSFLQVRNGDIWATGKKSSDTDQMYLFHFDADLRFIEEFGLNQAAVNSLASMKEASNGQLWIAPGSGWLLRFDPTLKKLARYAYAKLIPTLNDTHSGEVSGLEISRDGTVWVATQDGLIETRNQPGGVLFKRYLARPSGLRGNVITALLDDSQNPGRYLWVAVKDHGLHRFDKATGRCEIVLTSRQGLPDNTIWGLMADRYRRLWAMGNQGIFCLEPGTFRVVSFSRNEGVQGEMFNKKAYGQTPSGLMYAAGNNGFNVFDPNAIQFSQAKNRLQLVDLEVNNAAVLPGDKSEVLQKSITETPALELAYDQNTFRVFFSMLRYDLTANTTYRCRLEGYDPAPVDLKTLNFATYTRLPPGQYTLKVWGADASDSFNPAPITLSVRVRSPWFWSWWSILLYAALLGYVVYRFYQMQINRVRLREQLLFNQRETERLNELDRIKTNFFTNISHEFRTPLTLLVNPVQDLVKKYPKEGLLPLMQKNLTRLQALINQLLDLSKLEAGHLKPHFEEADLERFLNMLVLSFESMASSKQIALTYEVPNESGLVFFDADKIEKIVSNLLSNAIKFTPSNGRVTLTALFEPMGFTVQVQDNGPGIPPEDTEKIFERFYQLSNVAAIDSDQLHYTGSGIGLALVRELVEVLEGRIGVTSQVGEGTTFEVYLPFPSELVVQPVVPPIAVEPDPTELTTTLEDQEQPLLLLVEDNPDLRRYIKSHFEQNYQVIEAHDGQDGIEKAIAIVPDIIICDLMMPKLDGFGLCRKLKTNPCTNHVPIVMLTAKATREDRLEGLELGADDYLLKPFDSGELQVRVRNLLDNRTRMRMKYGLNQFLANHETKASTLDEKFLLAVRDIIDAHIADPAFHVEELANAMNISSVQLRRKLKALINQTVIEFIRNYRLEKAADMLQRQAGTVSEIAFQLGFESLPNFSKVFSKKYGKKPSEWRQ